MREAVNSSQISAASGTGVLRGAGRGTAAFLVFAALGVGASPAEAQRRAPREPGLLFGGGAAETPRTPVEIDPTLPRGSRIERAPRPRLAATACSNRRPVCVHSDREEWVGPAIEALESAYERLVFVLDLPPPRWDGGLGNTDGFDLYWSDEGTGDVAVLPDPRTDFETDQSSGFCRVEGPAPVERTATLCLAEAITLGLDAAETPSLRRAFASYTWLVTGSPTSADLEAFDELQATPGSSLSPRDRRSAGGALFLDHLDAVFGAGELTTLPAALFALSRGRTKPGAYEWNNEPDAFDVLRRTFDDLPQRMADTVGAFAVERAFLGERDDGTHFPELAWAGAFGNVRFDASVRLSELPKNLALPALEPLGSTYVWVSLDRAHDGATFAFRAQWEAPVAFKWSVVTVDANGEELRRFDVLYEERGTKAERQIVSLEGAAGIVLVGTNMGGVTLAHPFDPDTAPFEPHAYTLYLARL